MGLMLSATYFENIDRTSDLVHSLVDALSVLSSDSYLTFLIALQLGFAVIMMIIHARVMPLFLICIVFFASMFLSNINFIDPWVIASLLGSLSFTVIAYSIRQISKRKGWIKNRKNMAIIAGFVCLSMLFQISHIINQTYAADVNLVLPSLDQFDIIGQWLNANISKDDRVLNDRSFSGFYLDGSSLMNLTHTYWSDYLLSQRLSDFVDYGSKELELIEELNVVIWHNPNEPELIYPLLKHYNISYIVLLPESGPLDHAIPNGTKKYMKKPFTNEEYTRYFDSYAFLTSNLSLTDGYAGIYRVR